MGSIEDPEDGGAVAGAVFGAVGVYGVRHLSHLSRQVYHTAPCGGCQMMFWNSKRAFG